MGKLATVLGFCAALLFVAYLVSLFASFYIGFGIQETNKKYNTLHTQVRETELELQSKRSFHDEDGKAVLQSMEKVSGIKYLTPENVAVHSTSVNP